MFRNWVSIQCTEKEMKNIEEYVKLSIRQGSANCGSNLRRWLYTSTEDDAINHSSPYQSRIGVLISCRYISYQVIQSVPTHDTWRHADVLPTLVPYQTGPYCPHRAVLHGMTNLAINNTHFAKANLEPNYGIVNWWL